MTKAILANSDTCKLKPPTLIHLLAPIPVQPKKRVINKPNMIAISINSVILKINFGWSNKIKNTKGKNITNLFN